MSDLEEIILLAARQQDIIMQAEDAFLKANSVVGCAKSELAEIYRRLLDLGRQAYPGEKNKFVSVQGKFYLLKLDGGIYDFCLQAFPECEFLGSAPMTKTPESAPSKKYHGLYDLESMTFTYKGRSIPGKMLAGFLGLEQ